jgi:hypothetical protein
MAALLAVQRPRQRTPRHVELHSGVGHSQSQRREHVIAKDVPYVADDCCSDISTFLDGNFCPIYTEGPAAGVDAHA